MRRTCFCLVDPWKSFIYRLQLIVLAGFSIHVNAAHVTAASIHTAEKAPSHRSMQLLSPMAVVAAPGGAHSGSSFVSTGATKLGDSLKDIAEGQRAPKSTPALAAVQAMRVVAGFEEPLVPVGKPSARENTDLNSAIAAFLTPRGGLTDFPEESASFIEFLRRYPHSSWRVSILTNLGIGYYNAGYFSRAFAAWKQAWHSGRSITEPRAKAIVDRAVGELARMRARVGLADELDALFAEIGSRSLSGPATEMITGAHEGAWMMRHDYGTAYLCGPQALKNMLMARGTDRAKVAFLDEVKSGPHGFTLLQVADLAARANEGYRLIYRATNQPIPVPSVIHWRVSHYAAIVGLENGRYHITDPTFGGDLFISRAAIDAESSGYFLVPSSATQAGGWRDATASEAGRIYGMGFTAQNQPGSTTPDDKTQNDQPPPNPPTEPKCGGMCTADVHLMTVSLNLNDTPLGYRAPIGPPVYIRLTYNQREASQPANFSFFNVGAKWTLNVLSYIQDSPATPGSNVMRYVAGGGSVSYPVAGTGSYDRTTGLFPPEKQTQAVLARIPATGALTSYELRMPDGSKQVFSRTDGAVSGTRRVFLTQIVDPLGNALALNYDAQLHLESLTDAAGRSTTFLYQDTAHPLAVTQITDPFGRSATITYDANGRLLSILDVIGMRSSFTYDAAGLINAMTTPYGTSHFAYGENTSDNSRFLELTDALGYTQRVEFRHGAPGIPYSDPAAPTGMSGQNIYLYYRNTFQWDQHVYPITHTDYTRAQITHWLHNSVGQTSPLVESTRKPLEARVWYNYDNVSSIVEGVTGSPTMIGRVLDDASSQIVRYAYNSLGRPTQITDATGRITYFDYAPNNIDITRVRQQDSASTTGTLRSLTYDGRHLPLSSTDAANQTTHYVYNGVGQLLSEANTLGQTTSYEYDSLGRMTAIINANRIAERRYTFDALDRLASVTDSEGHVVQFEYDPLDRLTRTTYPDRTTTEYTYNRLDLVAMKDRLGRTTNYEYDANRRLTKLTDAQGLVTRYAYYENGVLKSITDPRGNITSWDIDIQGRQTAKHIANATVSTYSYENATSRVKVVADALDQKKTYSYFNDNRLKSITYTGAVNPTPGVTFTYDRFFPRRTSMTDGLGTTNFQYKPLGSTGALQVASEDGPYTNDTIAYQYDTLGRVITRTVDATPESFVYDAIGRLTGHASPMGIFNISYLGETDQPVSQSNGLVQTRWSYDTNVNDRRLTGISNSGVARSFQYAMNPEERVNSVTESVGGVTQQAWAYSYDSIDRVLTASPASGAQHRYEYDPAGNITASVNYAGDSFVNYNAANQATAVNGVARIYDLNGNVIDDGARAYKWDAENRLIGIQYKASASQSTVFRYDGFGRRLAIVDTNGIASLETRYLWCDDALCQARSASDVVTRRYYPEGEIIPASNTQMYYAQDRLGSVRDVLTSQSGSKVATFDYDPYGNLIATSGRVSTDIRYAGMFYHAQSGLYLANFRAYDPRVAQWLSRDPVGEHGGINLYAYTGGNSVNLIDPLGWASAPAPTDSNGNPLPPPAPLPPGKDSQPNSWVPVPGSEGGSRDTKWKPKYPVSNPGGGQPGASWDEPNGHWDVDDGKGGRKRYDPNGNEVDHDGNPISPMMSCGDSCQKSLATGSAIGGGYILYRCVRMLPSLLPPLWWTIPENAVLP